MGQVIRFEPWVESRQKQIGLWENEVAACLGRVGVWPDDAQRMAQSLSKTMAPHTNPVLAANQKLEEIDWFKEEEQ